MAIKGADDKGASPVRDSIHLQIAVEEWKKAFRDRAFKRLKPPTYSGAFRDGWNANASRKCVCAQGDTCTNEWCTGCGGRK